MNPVADAICLESFAALTRGGWMAGPEAGHGEGGKGGQDEDNQGRGGGIVRRLDMRWMVYSATAIGAFSWVAAEFFGVQFANSIWVLAAWANKGAPLPAVVILLLTLPPLGIATSLCLSLSAIRCKRERAAVKISAVSLALCAIFIGTVIWIENSK